MSGNKSFARSMNGINNIEINEVQFPDGSTITSASNIVQLDTTNDFTSNNSFNTNLPTSTKEHLVNELTDNMILNKKSADKLYSTTDNNDFITGFSRDGTTGEITLTQSNTGTPITSKAITNITDDQLTEIGNAVSTTDVIQEIDGTKTFVDFPKIKITYPAGLPPVIPDPTSNEQFATKKYVDDTTSAISSNTSAIGTNAQAISDLTTATNSSFVSATYTSPILKLTDIAGNDEDITIGGGGDAVLSAGSEASPQTFTGVNTFNSVNLKGNVFTENGDGIAISPIRRTLLSNTFATNNTGSKWIKIATLPKTSSGKKDITKVVLTGGDWTHEPMIITAWFRNREGFKYQYKIEGNSQDNNGGAFTNVFLFARSKSSGAVDIWIFIDGTSNYCVADWSIDSIEANVYKNPSSQSSPPTAGSLLFSSGNGGSNTSYPPNIIIRQAHHSFHASRNNPNAGNVFKEQGAVFNPNFLWSNIGGCFNTTTGKFTAKIRGIYMFKFSAFINQSSTTTSRPALYKNNVIRISSGDTIAQNGNQVFGIIPLDIGDLVHIASSYGRLYMYSHYQYNQFSGSLVAPY